MATRTATASVAAWVHKSKRLADAVVRQSTNDVIVRASRTAPGKMRGGSVKRGFVPRDLGGLAASLMSTLHGSTMLTRAGDDSYAMVITGMQRGDVATFVWTAPYARRLHYEYNWMWVDDAVSHWQRIVAVNVMRARNAVR